MDLSGGPNILEHVQKPVNITTYDTKWIPTSARFVVLGSYARATGCLQIYSLDMENNGVKLDKEVEKKAAEMRLREHGGDVVAALKSYVL